MSATIGTPGTVIGTPATASRRARLASSLDGLDASWWTVGLFAVLLSVVNGFVMTSMQITVGAVERLSPPFERWVRNAVLMVPFYAIAIVVALYAARRLAGEHRRPAVRLWAAVGTVIVAGVAVGMAHAGASAAYDYVLQVRHINVAEHLRHPLYRIEGSTPVLVGSAACDPTCRAIEATRATHLRALWLAVELFLVLDAVVVLWALAMRGGVLWKHRIVPAAVTA